MKQTLKLLAALIIITTLMAPVHAEITGWNNTYTNDNSTNITLPVNTEINFSIILNQSQNITWQLNENPLLTAENTSQSTLNQTFEAEGEYRIKASANNSNITWTVTAYTPLKIWSFQNNITDSNTSSVNTAHNQTLHLQVNRSGTILSETWTVNGSAAGTGAAADLNPDKYGRYNISYSVVGQVESFTINWTVQAYYEVTDALNTTQRFYNPPERIVSLAPSSTEILFAAGIGSKLVGTDDYSDYPLELTNMSLTKVGGPYSSISTETIVNLSADLVVATEINPLGIISQLKLLNITVLTIESKNIDEIMENILLLGRVGGTENAAETIVQNMSSRIDDVTDFSGSLDEERKPTLFYVVWYPELWTPGSGTYADDLIELAGGINIAGEVPGWYMLTKEALVLKNPDVIVCSGMGGYGANVCNQIRADPALSTLSAIKNDKMYVVPDSNIVERPGPRIIDGLELIYSIVKDNLRPAVKTSSGGGAGGATQQVSKVKSTAFTKQFQSFDDIEEEVRSVVSEKLVYSIPVDNQCLAVPILQMNRFPEYQGLGWINESIEKSPVQYSSEIAVLQYFFAKEIIIARADIPVDSFAALSLGKANKLPIILTDKESLSKAAEDAINRLRPEKIIVIGGGSALSEDLFKNIDNRIRLERIGGETRVETSIKIAEKQRPEKVIVAGYDSSIKAAVTSQIYGAPIIYVTQAKLEIVVDYLRKERPKIVFINVDDALKKGIQDGLDN
ncbi:vitamin B12-binding protein precursor [archaeon BMS3Abin16]|nr:vitamin B12-binding protein precursor [archaeon BMS3Abin16]HDY73749.1 hypothetical protein [Euryarchaeota archaeon]